jgi:ribosomal protein S18 acetylase RimI-like enzyme
MTITVRSMKNTDRALIDRLLSRVEVFSQEDNALAMQLVDAFLEDPRQKDYFFFIAVDENDQPVGYICYGPTPLTDGTYDLYWIAVDPGCAGKGIGTLMLRRFEDQVRAENGRLIVIETSSSPEYALTRQFYLKNGYRLAETIQDFFRKGEDRVTYVKVLRD